MKKELHTERTAASLPAAWDALCGHYFQRRAFLAHAEAFNPCNQRYYLWYDHDRLVAGAVAYTLQLDLLTFLRISSPLRMQIIGIPCSVSCPGIFGQERAIPAFKEAIFQHEPGLCLFLNLIRPSGNAMRVSGTTLPTIVLPNVFPNWAAYLASLRTHYRRRLHRIMAKGKDLTFSYHSCQLFSGEMYRQYLQVYHRSKDKLEKLSLDFFQGLPSAFKLILLRRAEQLLGWAITLHDAEQYYFFLGGVDYDFNNQYDTYFQLLTEVVRDGITSGASRIDLGQTAEIPKMRLGGVPESRYLEGQHHQPFLRKILKAGERWLVYRRAVPEPHVFKEALKPVG